MNDTEVDTTVHNIFKAFALLPPSSRKDPTKIKLAAVSAAITETIAEQADSSIPSAPLYFSALLSSLSSNASCGHYTDLLKLLSLTIPHTPATLLTNNVPALVTILTNVNKFASSQADLANSTLRSIVTTISTILTSLPPSPSTYANPATTSLLKLILIQFDDRRPKVRKHAHAELLAVLSYAANNNSTALSATLIPYLNLVITSTTPETTLPILHLFPFLAQALPHMEPIDSLISPLLSLTALKIAPVTQNALSTLESTISSSTTLSPNFLASLLTTLLKTTSTHLPPSDQLSQTSYTRLLSSSLSSLHSTSPELAAKLSPAVFSVLTVYANQSPVLASIVVTELRKLTSLHLITATHLPIFSKMLTYTSSHPLLLPFLGFLLPHFPGAPAAAVLLNALLETRRTAVACNNKATVQAATDAIGQIVGAIGPEEFLRAHPLTAPIPASQTWILDLLKSQRSASTAPTTLSFFQHTILPLARKCDAFANSSTVTALESNNAKQRVSDLWSIFPAFCRTATDVQDSFPAIALLVAKVMSDARYPDLLLTACAGLRALVETALEESNDDDLATFKSLEAKIMPSLFSVVDALSAPPPEDGAEPADMSAAASSTASKLSAVTATIATYSKACSPAFLASLFKKVMQKLLLATQTTDAKNVPKLMNLLDLCHAIVPTLDSSSVSLMMRAVKPMIRSDAHDALVQKRGYKVLLSLFDHHSKAITTGDSVAATVEFLTSSMMTVHVSARNMRLQCLNHVIGSLETGNKEQTGIIPTVIGEVMLCLKDSNKKTRESGYACLLTMCEKRADMQDFYQIILGGYAAQTPHMRSAAVMALSRVVFEYAGEGDDVTRELLPSLLRTTLLLFREQAREVIKSAVGFVRICVAAMSVEELEPLVGEVVLGLMKWNHGKDRFRAKIKIIMKKLVMRYGYETVRVNVPDEDARLMTHIRKIAERQARKKAANGGKSVRGSVHEGDFEDMLDSDEEDSDGAKTLMTGMTGFTQMTAKSGKTLRDSAIDKSERASKMSKAESLASAKSGVKGAGKGVLVREGEDYDMLDASMAKNLKYQNEYDDGYSDGDDSEDEMMEFDDKGRLIVEGGDGGFGKEAGGSDSEDDAELSQKLDKKMSQFMGGGDVSKNRPMKYEKAQEKMREGDKKRRKMDAKNAPGAAFKSKKAGGDVKKKGDKFEPYAYIPLDGKNFTKKHKKGAVEAMSHVVRKAGKGGEGKGKGGGGNKQLLKYEQSILSQWFEPSKQRGFNWFLEKLRRNASCLKTSPSKQGELSRPGRDWTFSPARTPVAVPIQKQLLSPLDTMNSALHALIRKEVPVAEIQKYEGSFLSFIGGVLCGDLQTLAGGPLFLLLATYYRKYGPVYTLAFGPKSFLIISDPVMAKHVLQSRVDVYSKGVLSEILEPIMGKGLIPADPETWKVRRRAIAPGFNKRWLNKMVTLFADAGDELTASLTRSQNEHAAVDMEERFCSSTLDIIGRAVFNYDFGSVNNESPIVKAVYRTLREAEHRTTSFIPYWNLPYANKWISSQIEFQKDMGMLDDILGTMINKAVRSRSEATVEELEARDNDDDPSLLRFLMDMRGEDVNSRQLRDDLMTMLIAGHETTAAVLTWTLFELKNGDPRMMQDIVKEIREVMGDKKRPDMEDLTKMRRLRLALTESLRLYPEPPILIRRALRDDVLPTGGSLIAGGVEVKRGTDIFISTWNLHRSRTYWGDDAAVFDPSRFERIVVNDDVLGWAGYDPDKFTESMLYPNEIASDFAFLPFGGGQRKCIGDQFAMMEAAVIMSMLLNKFDFDFKGKPEDVGMRTGATIHTMHGLNMYPRTVERKSAEEEEKEGGWFDIKREEYEAARSGQQTDLSA